MQQSLSLYIDKWRDIIFSTKSIERYKVKKIIETAIIYEDGYQIYAYRGIIIPKKYGKVAVSKWQNKWIAEEKDEEVREALKQGIYDYQDYRSQ